MSACSTTLNESSPPSTERSEGQADELSADPSPTTQATTTSLPAVPETTAPPTTAPPISMQRRVAGAITEFDIAPGGWILPSTSDLGAPVELVSFVEANDGEVGVTIDAEFLEIHASAEWLSNEDGRMIISGIDARGLCLNITVPLTLRDSHVACPSREQSDAWGYAGTVNDAPAVNILAPDVMIERNTIECTGSDRFICSRSVRINAERATVWFNDLSGARGAVQLYTDAFFGYNHVHGLAFGFDPSRVETPADNVTHNNVTNNQGYRGTVVRGNYIEATYGRTSTRPEDFRNPYFREAYEDGIVEDGDPINGFVFANYLHNGDGLGTVIERNYVDGAGRGFRCNASDKHDSAICAESLQFNVFANDQLSLFAGEPRFEDKDGSGVLTAACNFVLDAALLSAIESTESDECSGWDDRTMVEALVAADLLAWDRSNTASIDPQLTSSE